VTGWFDLTPGDQLRLAFELVERQDRAAAYGGEEPPTAASVLAEHRLLPEQMDGGGVPG